MLKHWAVFACLLAVAMRLDVPFSPHPGLSPRRGRTFGSATKRHNLVRFPARSKRAPSPWGEGRSEGDRDVRTELIGFARKRPDNLRIKLPREGTLPNCVASHTGMSEPIPMGPDRRGFLKRFCAGFISIVLGAIPFGAGLAVFLDPLRRKA